MNLAADVGLVQINLHVLSTSDDLSFVAGNADSDQAIAGKYISTSRSRIGLDGFGDDPGFRVRPGDTVCGRCLDLGSLDEIEDAARDE